MAWGRGAIPLRHTAVEATVKKVVENRRWGQEWKHHGCDSNNRHQGAPEEVQRTAGLWIARRDTAKNKRGLPVGDELQRGPEVLVVVSNPLHQGLPVGHLQLDAGLRVVEMGLVVLLSTSKINNQLD